MDFDDEILYFIFCKTIKHEKFIIELFDEFKKGFLQKL